MGERITSDIISACHICGTACDDHTNCANDACHLLFIQCKKCAQTLEGCCCEECQTFIHLPLEEQKEKRKGIDKGIQVYKKGRLRPKPGGKQD